MPSNMDTRKRQIRKEIYLTPSENKQIKRIMAEYDMPSFQYYAKNILCQGRVIKIDFSELKNLRIAISRIGGNINQIAKHANENGEISVAEFKEALEYLEEIRTLINAKISSEEKQSLKKQKRVVRTYDEW